MLSTYYVSWLKGGLWGIKRNIEGLPWGSPVVETSPSNAGGRGSIPGWGTKILYAATKDTVCCNQDQVRPNKYLKEKKEEALSSFRLPKVKVTQSSPTLLPHGLYSPWNSPGQNTGMGSLSLLQRIFPIQGSNPGLPHCRQILYQLSHKGSPRIPEWVAYPFSSGSSRPRNQTGVSCTAGRFFTNWAMREVLKAGYESVKGSPSHLYQMLITRNNFRPLSAQRRPQRTPHYEFY